MRPSTVLLGAAALLGACASGSGSRPAATVASAPGPPAASADAATPLVATLTPTNASGNRIAGRIRLAPTGNANEYRAEIDLRGGGYQNKFPWVVRTGQCGERGLELGNPTDYRLIETGGDGMARFNTTLRLAIPEGQTHHVAVLASPTNRGLVVSCGVLSVAS
jgi:hypothetical protein